MKHGPMRSAALAAVVGIAMLSGGCLVKDTTATLCLEPDGSVTWTVIERNIHATGDAPADRQREEEEFMAEVAADRHPNAVAFRDMGGTDARTDVISSRWPFAVLTEARFPDIARVVQNYFDRAGMKVESTLRRDGTRTTWTLVLDMSDETESGGSDASGSLDAMPDAELPIVVIQHGQFIDATGFDISDDGRLARPQDQSKRDWDREPRLVLSLTWVAAEAMNVPQK